MRHPSRRVAVLLVVLVILIAGVWLYTTMPISDRSTATRRAASLQRGVNLSGWFAQGPASPAHFQTAITIEDAQRIRRMGFDHVRLPVDPAILQPEGSAGADPDTLYYLDDAVRLVLDGGLAVVVDLHPAPGLGQRLAVNPTDLDRLATLWTVLARRLSARDRERVFFEVLNEPGIMDPAVWATLQARLALAIRQGAPEHTIIASGHAWSAVEHLEALRPLDDPNVIYAFHLYEPYAFTHQGATWLAEPVAALHQVPYPSSPAAVAPLLPTVSDSAARSLLAAYGEERWDAAAIGKLVGRAAAWRDRFGVPIVCTEFGVYRAVSPAEARFAWLRDARTALEQQHIGWTAWDYAGGFGIVDGPPGQRVTHAPTARALFGE